MLCFKCFSKFRCSTAWHWNDRPLKRKHVSEPESVSGGSPVAASVLRSGLRNRAGPYPRCAFTRARWVDAAAGPMAQTPP